MNEYEIKQIWQMKRHLLAFACGYRRWFIAKYKK